MIPGPSSRCLGIPTLSREDGWNARAWRRGGFTFNLARVEERAAHLGQRTSAVSAIIAASSGTALPPPPPTSSSSLSSLSPATASSGSSQPASTSVGERPNQAPVEARQTKRYKSKNTKNGSVSSRKRPRALTDAAASSDDQAGSTKRGLVEDLCGQSLSPRAVHGGELLKRKLKINHNIPSTPAARRKTGPTRMTPKRTHTFIITTLREDGGG